tara:strand:- start:438 stop:683 length:246 start_codon:yes stop_codon:yes gene_type:complete
MNNSEDQIEHGIEENYILSDISMDAINRILDQKHVKIKIENQKNHDWNLFIKRAYNLNLLGFFSFVMLGSFYIFLQIINQL